MVSTQWLQVCPLPCVCTVMESATVIRVSGEGLLRVCTELPSGQRFKTAAQDQSQSESSASELIKCLWKVKKRRSLNYVLIQFGSQVLEYTHSMYVCTGTLWRGMCVFRILASCKALHFLCSSFMKLTMKKTSGVRVQLNKVCSIDTVFVQIVIFRLFAITWFNQQEVQHMFLSAL